MKSRHLITGVAFWFLMLGAGWLVVGYQLEAQSSSVSALSADVELWLTGQKQDLEAVCEYKIQMALGDPVFLELEDGSYRHVGRVKNLDDIYDKTPRLSDRMDVTIYSGALQQFPDGFQLDYHTTPMSLDWVVKMMIPPERQQKIAQLIATEWQVHQKEIMTELRPVMQDGLRTAVRAVEAELPAILRSHRDEFRKLGERYESDIVKAEILPLVRDEILPIVEEEAIPVAQDLGKALWKRVSLWSFTWRYIYDKSPLPERDAVKTEFQRFIDEEALPELRSRTDQFIDVTETIVKRAMDNPKVKAAMKKNIRQVAEDPELHRLIWLIVREAIIENETLRKELDAYLKEHETKAAMKLAGTRLEPVVRKIGDMIFGGREEGITPSFSRILRLQILAKDRRWFVMTPASEPVRDGIITIDYTDTPMLYPMEFGGADHSPLTSAAAGAAK